MPDNDKLCESQSNPLYILWNQYPKQDIKYKRALDVDENNYNDITYDNLNHDKKMD